MLFRKNYGIIIIESERRYINDKKELDEIIKKHKLWLEGESGGERADLSHTDLQGAYLQYTDLRLALLRCADLRCADLRGTDLRGTDLRDINLQWANLQNANLQNANLRDADLFGADLLLTKLRGADLRGANLDFSCLPLWCGSLTVNFDDAQLKQIAYHLVKVGLQSKNASKEAKNELKKIVEFANGFHRVDECGRIEVLDNDL